MSPFALLSEMLEKPEKREKEKKIQFTVFTNNYQIKIHEFLGKKVMHELPPTKILNLHKLTGSSKGYWASFKLVISSLKYGL